MPEKTATRYIETTGGRKTSTARVRLTPASKLSLEINGRSFENYFPTAELRQIINNVFTASELTQKFSVSAHITGGGVSSQVQALAHGIARGLIEYDVNLRAKLKPKGMLKRDPRAKERRKFGLKKARKAPQWSKR